MQVRIDIGGGRVINHLTGKSWYQYGNCHSRENISGALSEVCFDEKGFRIKRDGEWLRHGRYYEEEEPWSARK